MADRDDQANHATSSRSMFGLRLQPRSANEALQPVAPPPPPPMVKLRRHPLVTLSSNLMTLVLVAAVVATAVFWTVKQMTDAPGPLAEEKVVRVSGGAFGTATDLEDHGVVANRFLAFLKIMTSGEHEKIIAGEYAFKKEASLSEVIRVLTSGRRVQHSITIPEGLTSLQIVERLRASDLLAGDIRDLPREGSLMPDTYKFERGYSRATLVRLMADTQQKFLQEVWKRKSAEVPITNTQDLVTLASIVEKETGRADERTRVAGVFINRLKRGQRLESDPTIVYGLVQGKGTLGRAIQKDEIRKPTAYNTYVIPGLPPGPIANPGRAALEAVANPSRTKDLFFVADGSGGHAFAETLEQHNANVRRWRQLEKTRGEQAAVPVDRVETPEEPPATAAPPAAPGATPRTGRRSDAIFELLRRTDLPPSRFSTAGVEPPPGDLPPVTASRRGFVDVVAGTKRDPLLNKSFDLNSSKTVPVLR